VSLRELLEITERTKILDVGDWPIDGDPPYKPMLDAGFAQIIGVDAQNGQVFGDGSDATLYHYRSVGFTSLLRIDPEAIKFFSCFREHASLLHGQHVQTKRLDDSPEIGAVDFFKSDCQGSELTILRHGWSKLAAAAVVQLEVSFVPLYEGQPAFGEIDCEMRAHGFIPHTFEQIKSWPQSQLLEADLVYMPDFIHPDAISDNTLKQMALIVHYCYGNRALVAHLIGLLERRGVIYDATRQYRRMVATVPKVAAEVLYDPAEII
jgi:hypothetical protein